MQGYDLEKLVNLFACSRLIARTPPDGEDNPWGFPRQDEARRMAEVAKRLIDNHVETLLMSIQDEIEQRRRTTEDAGLTAKNFADLRVADGLGEAREVVARMMRTGPSDTWGCGAMAELAEHGNP